MVFIVLLVDIEIGGGRKIDLTLALFNVVGTKLFNYRIGEAVHQYF